MPHESAPPSGNGPLHPKFPLLTGFDTGYQFVAWCDQCECWHYHNSLRRIGEVMPAVLKDLQRRRPKPPARLGISTEAAQ